ncbi:MAG TPA: hypothetical protein VEK33_23675 [Terriglobales bacterium]|nr:hypothetical protein [Terriglobales bacterium]
MGRSFFGIIAFCMGEKTRRASAALRCRAIACLISLMNLTALATPATDRPSVGFSCDFPGSDPAHYAIRVSSDGHGNYSSNGKLSRDSDADETFSLEFSLPQTTATRIFDLAQKAHYFEGNLDSKRKNIASTGEKTLTYVDARKNTSATYNYSIVPAVQELTAIFQNLSTMLESGRRLEYDLRYQKLALDEELQQLQETSTQSSAADIAVVAPVLEKIVSDSSVLNGARARAQRLLQSAGLGK